MIYLVLVVLLNALLAVIFKLFDRFKINHVQAIVFNYWVCILTGSLFLGEFPIRPSSCSQPWFPFALLMGVGFISVFNLFAYCTKYEGITALLFVGSGLLDTLMKYVQQQYLHSQALQAVYTIHIFSVAGTIGLFVLAYLRLRNQIQFSWRNVLGGIVLGIPNYFSIYFFIRMLNSNCLKSSALIPLSNIGVLFASTLFAIVCFKESMNVKRWIGVFLSLVVIVLLASA